MKNEEKRVPKAGEIWVVMDSDIGDYYIYVRKVTKKSTWLQGTGSTGHNDSGFKVRPATPEEEREFIGYLSMNYKQIWINTLNPDTWRAISPKNDNYVDWITQAIQGERKWRPIHLPPSELL